MKILWNFQSELFLLVKIGEGGVSDTRLYKVTFTSFPQFFFYYDSIENTTEIDTPDTHKLRGINTVFIYIFFLIDLLLLNLFFKDKFNHVIPLLKII